MLLEPFFDPKLIVTGIGIGLLISAPVGPVNVMCIQRTLERGFWGGVAAGMGALLGDTAISSIAAFGITVIAGIMTEYKLAIQLIGGLILLAFGLKLWLSGSGPEATNQNSEKTGLSKNSGVIPQTFFLTITNPGAVLGIFALFSGVGSLMGGLESYMKAMAMVLAVATGAAIWWIGLSWIIATIRHKLNERRLRFINQAAGLVLILFGIALIFEPYLGFDTGLALQNAQLSVTKIR